MSTAVSYRERAEFFQHSSAPAGDETDLGASR
jgi:hypothetical protein